jgi:myo-inositol-1(or 4)-monophosphatase
VTKTECNELAEAAEAIAREAGALIRSRIARPGAIQGKSSSIDLVTDTDRAANALIIERLAAVFPSHVVLSEEGPASNTSSAAGAPRPGATDGVCWVIDPLDGTMNFAHGFPHFAVSIAAVTRSGAGGSILAGAVYDPMRDELFRAGRDSGATLNGEPIRVSTAGRVDSCLLATGFPYDRRERSAYYVSFFQEVMIRSHDVRRAGAAAIDLAWVACGRLDGFWEFGLHAWDIAAGSLIVRQAGGRVTDFSGADVFLDSQQTLASNGLVHDELIEIIAPLLRASGDGPEA